MTALGGIYWRIVLHVLMILSIHDALKVKRWYKDAKKDKIVKESVDELPDNVVEELKKLGVEDKFYESDEWNEAEAYIKEVIDNPEEIKAAGVKPEIVIAAFIKVAYNNWSKNKNKLEENVSKLSKYDAFLKRIGVSFLRESIDSLPEMYQEKIRAAVTDPIIFESDIWAETEKRIKDFIKHPEKAEKLDLTVEEAVMALVRIANRKFVDEYTDSYLYKQAAEGKIRI